MSSSVKHSYSKQPKLYSFLCPNLAVSDVTEHNVWISTVLAKTKRAIYSIKEKRQILTSKMQKIGRYQRMYVTPGQKWKWFTHDGEKKDLSHPVTLPITGPCQALQGRAQGGVPQSIRLPHVVPCCNSIIPWHPPSSSGCDDYGGWRLRDQTGVQNCTEYHCISDALCQYNMYISWQTQCKCYFNKCYSVRASDLKSPSDCSNECYVIVY